MNSSMQPSFIGVGAQKCATTWIHRILEDHPAVCMPRDKEIDFFSERYDLGRQWYERRFERGPETLVAGEVSPSYLSDSDSPARAAAYNPRFRLVVVLRDPVERAYSNHLHDLRIGVFRGPDLSFESGLANNPMYVDQSRYWTHFSRWLEHFDASRCLVLLTEDILEDPPREALRLYRFLGVDPEHRSRFLHRRANPALGYRSRLLERTFHEIGASARRVLGDGTVDRVKDQGWFRRLRAGNRYALADVIPPMCRDTEQRLMDELAGEVLRIGRFLGRSSLPWKTWRHAAGHPQPRSRRELVA